MAADFVPSAKCMTLVVALAETARTLRCCTLSVSKSRRRSDFEDQAVHGTCSMGGVRTHPEGVPVTSRLARNT